MIGGRPLVGDVDTQAVFDARGIRPAPLRIDGRPGLAAAALVQRIRDCPILEPGVDSVA